MKGRFPVMPETTSSDVFIKEIKRATIAANMLRRLQSEKNPKFGSQKNQLFCDLKP